MRLCRQDQVIHYISHAGDVLTTEYSLRSVRVEVCSWRCNKACHLMAGANYVEPTPLNLGDDTYKHECIQTDSNKTFKTVHTCIMTVMWRNTAQENEEITRSGEREKNGDFSISCYWIGAYGEIQTMLYEKLLRLFGKIKPERKKNTNNTKHILGSYQMAN